VQGRMRLRPGVIADGSPSINCHVQPDGSSGSQSRNSVRIIWAEACARTATMFRASSKSRLTGNVRVSMARESARKQRPRPFQSGWKWSSIPPPFVAATFCWLQQRQPDWNSWLAKLLVKTMG
jgi:hypothetical protein